MKPVIYPYKMYSGSAKRLAEALGAKRVWPDRNYRPRNNHLIINWGSTRYPTWAAPIGMGATDWDSNIVNHFEFVALACNKLYALSDMDFHNVPVPEYTTDVDIAADWLHMERVPIVERKTLTGHSGNGIVLHTPGDEVVTSLSAPLYVKYFKKKHEYRIHVFNGKVIDVQQKKKRRETDVNYQVRNHANGWVYCREDVSPPEEALDISIKAVAALGLDFGAVDVAWNEHYNKCVVFEVNTAPGLYGTTLDKYVEAIKEML